MIIIIFILKSERRADTPEIRINIYINWLPGVVRRNLLRNFRESKRQTTWTQRRPQTNKIFHEARAFLPRGRKKYICIIYPKYIPAGQHQLTWNPREFIRVSRIVLFVWPSEQSHSRWQSPKKVLRDSIQFFFSLYPRIKRLAFQQRDGHFLCEMREKMNSLFFSPSFLSRSGKKSRPVNSVASQSWSRHKTYTATFFFSSSLFANNNNNN